MPDEQNPTATAAVTWGERLLTEVVTLAAVPAAAAVTVLLYEWGQCSYFGVPVELATASVWSAFPALALAVVLVLLAMAAGIFQAVVFERLRWPAVVGCALVLSTIYSAVLGLPVTPSAVWLPLAPLIVLLVLTRAPWVVLGRTVGDHLLVALNRFGRRHAAVVILALFVVSAGYPCTSRGAPDVHPGLLSDGTDAHGLNQIRIRLGRAMLYASQCVVGARPCVLRT